MNRGKDPSLNRAAAQQALRDELRARGYRLTRQRLAILETAFLVEGHFSAEDLWKQSRKIDSGVSLPTVYRILRLMVECGYLTPLRLVSDKEHYAAHDRPAPTKSNHIVCKDCDKVIAYDAACMELREGALIDRLGFKADSWVFRVEARCKSFSQSGSCENKESLDAAR